jgi:hypothetical protein
MGQVAPMGFRSAYSALVGNLAEKRTVWKYTPVRADNITMAPDMIRCTAGRRGCGGGGGQ